MRKKTTEEIETDPVKINAAKDRKLANLISKLNSDFDHGGAEGEEFCVSISNLELLKPKFLDTGITQINEALGDEKEFKEAGFIKGDVSAVYGESGSGKSGISISTSADVIRKGGRVLYMDTDGKFPYDLFKQYIAVIPGFENKFVRIRPHDNGEDMITALDRMLFDPKTKELLDIFDFIVIDSINNIVPTKIINKMIEEGVSAEGQMAQAAALQTKLLNRIKGQGLLRNGASLLLISETRANMNANTSKYEPDVLPGAYKLQFACKQIIKMSKKKLVKKDKNGLSNVVGHKIVFQVTKNNVFGYMKRGEYAIMHGQGLDDSMIVVNKCLDWGYILKTGKSQLSIPLDNGDWIFKNKAELFARAQMDLDFKNKLKAQLRIGKPTEPVQLKGVLAEMEEYEVNESDD